MRHKSLSSTMIYCAVYEEELRNGIAGLQTRVTAPKVDYFRTEASAARAPARTAREDLARYAAAGASTS